MELNCNIILPLLSLPVWTYHQNGGQNHDIIIAKRSFKNVAVFKYLGRR
jgi:hypothetical protein